jgi:PKD repeat protein
VTGRPLTHARRLALLVAAALLALSAPASADAIPAPSCSTSAATFCADFSSTVTTPGTSVAETAAGAPADLTVVLNNSSTGRQSDAALDRWWDHLTFSGFFGAGAPRLTPSAQLPNGLLLAGTGAPCSADAGGGWTACTAGYGTALVNISGTGGLADGVHSGSFGIKKIESVDPPTVVGAVIDDLVTLDFCVNTALGACSLPTTVQAHLVGLPGTGTDPGPITMTAKSSYDYNYGPGTAHADGSLDSITLHLLGSSTHLSDGTVVQSRTTLAMPRTCGANVAGLSVTDRHADTLALTMSLPTTGCPTAAFTDAETVPLAVSLNGAGSTTPLAGRTLARWHWTFGDGTSAVTTGAGTTHTYPAPGARTVALQVEDSLGALSPVVSRTIAGSTLSLGASPSTVVYGGATRLSGVLRTSGTTTGLGGRTVNLLRCTATYGACVKAAAVLTSKTSSTLGRFDFVIKPAANTGYRVEFGGGVHQLGTRAQGVVTVRVTVSVTASATSLRLGRTVTLSGTVGPNRAGQRSYLQRWSGYSWSSVAVKLLTSRSGYAFAVRPGSRGTSYYQVVYAGDPTHLGGVSHPVMLQTS